MRKIILVIIFFIPFLVYSQKIELDTITKVRLNGKESKYVMSNWKLKASAGVINYFYDDVTSAYFDNHLGANFKLALFYKNFFLEFGYSPATIQTKDTLFFFTANLSKEADLKIVKTDITFGYTINLPYNFSIQPYAGYLKTSFSVTNEEKIHKYFVFNPVRGYTGGITINKYIPLKNKGEFFVVYLNSNFNYSNYKKMHFFLGETFYAIEFGIAYKLWIGNKIE